jgi:hypothetical protein
MVGPDTRLMNALSFTAGDLEVNKQGLLTEAQQGVLDRKRAVLVRNFLVYCLFVLGVVSLFFLAQKTLDSLKITVGVGFGVVLLGLFSPILFKWQKIGLDMREGIVHSVEGQVRLDIQPVFRGGAIMSLSVNGVEFRIPKEVLFAFQDHEPYKLYYVPLSKVLVSAE